jgi:hypothetical protein
MTVIRGKALLNKIVYFFLFLIAIILVLCGQDRGRENYQPNNRTPVHFTYLLERINNLDKEFDGILFTQIKKEDVNLAVELPESDVQAKQKKYYFKDDKGNFYLFKTNELRKVIAELIANRISIFLGAQVVPVFYKELIIDGQNIKGVMVKLLSNSRRLRISDLKQLRSCDVKVLLKNEAIDIFVMNEDIDFKNYLVLFDKDNKIEKIIQIDKDDSFTQNFVNVVLSDLFDKRYTSYVYFFIWRYNFSLTGFDYKEGIEMAKLIESVPDKIISKIFYQAVEKCSEYDSYKSIIKYAERMLIERKKGFCRKYMNIINKIHMVDISLVE